MRRILEDLFAADAHGRGYWHGWLWHPRWCSNENRVEVGPGHADNFSLWRTIVLALNVLCKHNFAHRKNKSVFELLCEFADCRLSNAFTVAVRKNIECWIFCRDQMALILICLPLLSFP